MTAPGNARNTDRSTSYLVMWSMDMDGDSHREAAEFARSTMTDPCSDATTFHVRGPDGRVRVVDVDAGPDADHWQDEPTGEAIPVRRDELIQVLAAAGLVTLGTGQAEAVFGALRDLAQGRAE